MKAEIAEKYYNNVYFAKIIWCLSMLCRTISNYEEIPKCVEITNESRNSREIL